MVPLNYRLHFYWGFGPAVNSKSKIFDRTHFLPDEAVSSALGCRTDASSAAKRLKVNSAFTMACGAVMHLWELIDRPPGHRVRVVPLRRGELRRTAESQQFDFD